MTKFNLHTLLLQLLALLMPVAGALARRQQPTEVTRELFDRLPVLGKLNPTSMDNIAEFYIEDFNGDSLDEIIYKTGVNIELSTLLGDKFGQIRFSDKLHGWSVLKVKESGEFGIFIFREIDGWAWMEVYSMKNEILANEKLFKIVDRDSSGNYDFYARIVQNFIRDFKNGIIIELHATHDSYPQSWMSINFQQFHITQTHPITEIDNNCFIDIDKDKTPEFLISRSSPSTGALIGDLDGSQSAVVAINGSNGLIIWNHPIGGPFSYVQHRLIDLEDDGIDDILVAEHSDFIHKKQNSSLRVLGLHDGVEVLKWECTDKSRLINCFAAWGKGNNSTILIGFSDNSLVKFDTKLNPSLLYHFFSDLNWIYNVDINGDRLDDVLIGLKDGSVVILDDKLNLVGRQKFNRPPVPVHPSEAEFGEFVIVSEGLIYGWSVLGVAFKPLASGVIQLLQRWYLYMVVFFIIALTIPTYIRHGKLRKIRYNEVTPNTQSLNTTQEPSSDMTVNLHELAERVLTEENKKNIRRTICSEILLCNKETDSFDYMIFLLGDAEIYSNSGEILDSQWQGSKRKPLLCLFLKNINQTIHREKLMDLFWQDCEPNQAYKNLRTAIHRLNHELSIQGKGRFISALDQCYSINQEYRIFIDTHKFESLIVQGDKLHNDNLLDKAIDNYLMAIRIYVGDYLTNLYDPWCETYRMNLRKLYVHAQKQVGRFLLKSERSESALCFFRNALLLDEYSEEIYIEIMRCHAACGNRKAVDLEYQRLLKVLKTDFDSQPRPETTRIYQSLVT